MLAIDLVDRTVVTLEFPTGAQVNPPGVERQRSVVVGVALGFARIAAMIALASTAILVLLPAAIAAQAAVAI